MERPRLDDLYRSQHTMVLVRWIALPWAIFQFVVYPNPYPPGYTVLGIFLLALLGLGNGVIHFLNRSRWGLPRAAAIAVLGMALDVIVISGIVWLYAFDPESALWALLFILPLEGAISFQLVGALGAWGASTLIYIAREIYGSDAFDYPLESNSITYRMGIGAVIALVAGFMARDLIRERARLSDALVEVQRVDQIRSGLISTLGHDVRNPLTVIRGAIDTLLKSRDRLANEDVQMLLSGADRQARRMEVLATDLLDLARLEAGRLELDIQKVPVHEVARSALSYLETEEGFTTRIEEDLRVEADPQRLEQVIYNLVSNAVRHGEPPFAIEAESNGTSVTIHVVDHGTGVAPEQEPYLFEPFRADTSGGSVGYGLAIVEALVTAQGGTVSYRRNDPQGARFSIALRAAA